MADRWPTPAVLMVFIVVGLATWVWRGRNAQPVRPLWRDTPTPPWLRDTFLLVIFGGGLLVSGTFAVLALGRYVAAQHAREGKLLEVVGPVEDFQDEVGRWKPEQFRVGGVTFRYSTQGYTPGFHHTRARGGPIAPGLFVRIGYASIGGSPTILTLDVCR